MEKQRVLFICTHNSARSQMAEGLLRTMYPARFDVFSAGTEATFVKTLAVVAMAEAGIDLSRHTSKTVDVFRDTPMDYVVTVCDNARENCPYFPAREKIIHKSFEDPSDKKGSKKERLAAFIKCRDEIKAWIIAYFGPIAKHQVLGHN